MNSQINITLEEWAGAQRLNLALVFTDIVDSTNIGYRLGDDKWMQELSSHFHRGRELGLNYDCYIVKVIGDAFFVAFRNSTDAVNFAVEFSKDTGVDFIGIRVGVHSGQVQLMDNDIYGLNVNYTARIQSSIKGGGICVSDSIKEDFEKTYGSSIALRFSLTNSEIKNFRNAKTWKVGSKDLFISHFKIAKRRQEILGIKTQTAPQNASLNASQHTNKHILTPINKVSEKPAVDSATNSNLFRNLLLRPTQK